MNHSFTVRGMTCGHCEKAVVLAIKTLDPAADVQADRTQNRVDITSELSQEALASAIQEEGYAVEPASPTP